MARKKKEPIEEPVDDNEPVDDLEDKDPEPEPTEAEKAEIRAAVRREVKNNPPRDSEVEVDFSAEDEAWLAIHSLDERTSNLEKEKKNKKSENNEGHSKILNYVVLGIVALVAIGVFLRNKFNQRKFETEDKANVKSREVQPTMKPGEDADGFPT